MLKIDYEVLKDDEALRIRLQDLPECMGTYDAENNKNCRSEHEK